MESSIENSVVEKNRRAMSFASRTKRSRKVEPNALVSCKRGSIHGKSTSAVTEQYPQAREPLSDGVCEQRCGGGSAVSSGNEGGGVRHFSSRWSARRQYRRRIRLSFLDQARIPAGRVRRPEQLGMTAGAFAANTARLLHHISQLRNLLYSSEPMLATGRRTGG